HDGVIFVHNNGDKISALDAANGDLLWEYSRRLDPKLLADNGIWLTKRNMAIYGDKLIVATSDVHLVALDAKTGAIVWDVAAADWAKGWRYTGGPMIVEGQIVQGMTGCGNGQEGGCFIAGYDPANGKELWRLHTVAQDGPAGDTWNGLPLERRFGGSAWNAGSYDPEQKLIYWGVAQPYGWSAYINGLLPRSGKAGTTSDALYTDSTLAIEPKTGKLQWHFQHLPMDTWDLDYAYERVLVDLPVGGGAVRKQSVTVGKLGIIESIDRTNGQWLWHKETVPQNVVTSIDAKTGKKTINEASIPQISKTTVNCPADPGGRGWPATAYNPMTQTLYLPLNEFCSNSTVRPLEPGQSPGRAGITFVRTPVPNSDGNIGRLDAVRLTDRSTVWSHRQRAPMTSGLLPTGGGLVFGGDLNRYFRAYDAKNGKVLWEQRLNNAVNSFPISYGVKGKQYVAVVTGNGSAITRAMGGLTPEISNPLSGSTLWVFALPD
ncbi:MAG: hypothetical protein JWO33_2020, partial [Caulobacteraceae bacterium]|nr:hypothetical protein [Caulobacteraceae bacterium]